MVTPWAVGERQDAVMTILVGTSGWTYGSWAGPFYPPGVAKRRWLEHYAGRLPTVELNASHYRWPSDKAFTGWQERLPVGEYLAASYYERWFTAITTLLAGKGVATPEEMHGG